MPTAHAAIAERIAVPASGAEPSEPVHDQAASLPVTLAALGAAETVLALAHLGLGLGLVPVAILHFAIVGFAAHRLLTEQPQGTAVPAGTDVTARALIVFATAAAGPIGVLAGWLFARASAQPATPSPLLDEWYRRIALSAEIDPVTELCDNVASGRTMNLASPVPQSFLTVMTAGTISDQQTALGLIARRFHPDYLPALTRALRSSEPVIRVQAAAVVARIRDQLQAMVRVRLAAFDDGARPKDAASALSELAKAARSGLLDETDRRRAEVLIAREALPGQPQRDGSPVMEPASAMSGYRALRVARKRRRVVRKGAYRVRPLRRAKSKDSAA